MEHWMSCDVNSECSSVPNGQYDTPQANLDPADIRERVVEGEGLFILQLDVLVMWCGRRCHNFSLAVG